MTGPRVRRGSLPVLRAAGYIPGMGATEDEARRERLRRALRENLKRRKAQQRGRTPTPASEPVREDDDGAARDGHGEN